MIKQIASDEWAGGLAKLAENHRLFGPVRENSSDGVRRYHNFKALGPGELPDLTLGNTRLSAKSLVFPQSEAMFTYTLDESQADHHILKEMPADEMPRVVLGIRPCDAKALAMVRMNFDTPEYKDPYWLRLYEATTFIGLACDAPCSTCFCTSTGCGPYHEEGLDVLLCTEGEGFAAKALTEKGEKLLAAAGWDQEAEADLDLDARKTAAEGLITSRIDTDRLADLDLLELHGADFWEDVAFACINCGTCTYLCPTCWCFDIQDEVFHQEGKRLRHWDSCMFPIFTVHTTGHNPRDTKTQRVRQRFMHKLKYFVDKYEKGIMCVGCGRCVRHCPVNIDIRRVAGMMNRYGSDAAETVKA
ncbi:MAG: 4Fe-4S dicluster domain-containing protein [Desulfosarcinaceae bacterium]|jgi:ferredoxin